MCSFRHEFEAALGTLMERKESFTPVNLRDEIRKLTDKPCYHILRSYSGHILPSESVVYLAQEAFRSGNMPGYIQMAVKLDNEFRDFGEMYVPFKWTPSKKWISVG